MNLKREQYFVYAWRYEGDAIACKIGKSSVGAFWGRTAPARTHDYRDIEILGIQLCDSEADAKSQEKYLRNKRFERVRPDREWVYLTDDVWNWINTDCMENPPQLKEFDVFTNHRQGKKGEERNITEKARQRKKRAKEKLDAEEYEAALEGFDGVLELRPNDAETYFYLGIARYELEGPGYAVVDNFGEAIRLKPDMVEAYLYRGECKVFMADFREQYDNAIADFDKAIQLEPDSAAAYVARGLTDFDEIVCFYDEVIRLNPQDVKAYFYRGVAKFYLNQGEEAKQDFLIAKQLVEQAGNTCNIFRVDQYLHLLK
ncbi:MAG: tetratricopeptide repeat protein [Candidatus Poribacteria bacterium]|nr:tetratricopeptide repeat protein [Candidatus Poribacteria bacterium]